MINARIFLVIGGLLAIAGCATHGVMPTTTPPVQGAGLNQEATLDAEVPQEEMAPMGEAPGFGLLAVEDNQVRKLNVLSAYGSSQHNGSSPFGFGAKNCIDNKFDSFWGPSKFDRNCTLTFSLGRTHRLKNFKFRMKGRDIKCDVFLAAGNGRHVLFEENVDIKDLADFKLDTFASSCRFVFKTPFPEELRIGDFGCFGTFERAPISFVPLHSRTVLVRDFTFFPEVLEIPRGTTVIWRFTSFARHTTTSDTGKWNSGVVPQGGRFALSFDRSGRFPYHSNNRSSMRGKVVVF